MTYEIPNPLVENVFSDCCQAPVRIGDYCSDCGDHCELVTFQELGYYEEENKEESKEEKVEQLKSP